MFYPLRALKKYVGLVHLGVVATVVLLAAIGWIALYSAAGGHSEPWMIKQMMRFAVGLGIMGLVLIMPERILYHQAYVFYGIVLSLLIMVEIKGIIGMGARRWIDLYFIQIQPSELMKVVIIFPLARFLANFDFDDMRQFTPILGAFAIVLVPVLLVMHQPDLGTAMMLLGVGSAIIIASGLRRWKIVVGSLSIGLSFPVMWQLLHEYQRARIITFLNPESDPLGTGYHIIQSKIALGSGGLWGKGLLHGTQSQLDFLPEKQTDFIFSLIAEEFGFMGCCLVLSLYALLISYGFMVMHRARNLFFRLVALGLTTTLFLYAFCNTAMVVGLIPVVGVPLPLLSYGGTASLTFMLAIALLMLIDLHRDHGPRRLGVE